MNRGAFSIVKEGVHKKTEKKYAIKITQKKHVDSKQADQLRREIEIMKSIDHPNVIHVISTVTYRY